ncbi:MAG: universal stress protein [Halanaeroarchaeum sp.]
MFDDILVPTDGSENALKALDHALLLAGVFDATVHGVYVVNVTYAADFEGGIDSGTVYDALQREGEGATEAIRDRCEAAGVDVRTDVVDGRPARSIVEYAAENDVDLVAMGTHGRSGVSRLLLGSVTESVLRRTDRDVLTVPKDAPDPGDGYSTVLVAADGSEDSAEAVARAIDLASPFGAVLRGLYVVDASFTHNELVEDLLEREGETVTADIEEDATAAGVPVETAIADGEPHEEIVDYAAETDASVIVLGSHGKGAIERTVLGSVSERTVRTANRPVLIVRDRSSESPGEPNPDEDGQ